MVSGKECACSAGNTGDLGLIPGSGRSLGAGQGNSLQYSRGENPIDRGAGQAAVRGVIGELDMTEATELQQEGSLKR